MTFVRYNSKILDGAELTRRLDDLRDVEVEVSEGVDALDEYESEELRELTELVGEFGETTIRDTTFIADAAFADHARELAEDLGFDSATWPGSCVDWQRAADELKHDYESAVLDGYTFWFRI